MLTTTEHKLTELLGARHVHTLTGALRVAAERYDEDAATFDTIARQGKATRPNGPAAKTKGTADLVPLFTVQGAERLAEQFRRQAADARELLAAIEIGEEEEAAA